MSQTYSTTAIELSNFAVPVQTRTYKPVEHARLIDYTRESLDKSGLIITREEYDQAHSGAEANGRYIVTTNDREMGLMVGWQNSYNKSFTLKFAIGSHVFICSNGMIVGDMGTFKRKHVGDVQIFTPEKMSEYISAAGENFQIAQKSRDRMREVEITKRNTAELLGRMFIEEAVITSTQLNIIKREIDNPSHNYNAEGTIWELYNHTTFALKEAAPYKWMEQHLQVHDFFTSAIN